MSAPRTRSLARPTRAAKARKREIETANLKIVDRMLAIAQVSNLSRPNPHSPPSPPSHSKNPSTQEPEGGETKQFSAKTNNS